jgi:hypothetical protein
VITELNDMPSGVIGFEVGGRVGAEDYVNVVQPALERASRDGNTRYLVVIPEFEGMTGGAMWDDVRLGVQHMGEWKRIALVTDIAWMTRLMGVFGWVSRGDARVFPLSERQAALAWLAAG